jgi:hypothetical protein
MFRIITLLSTVLLFQQSRGNNAINPAEEKIITITVNQYSQVFIGPDTLTIADLGKELENRLWRNFLGTGKSYDAIKLSFTGDVSQPTRLATIAQIKSAQKIVLKNISLDKHDKAFEDLDAEKQDKLRKQFPVLFQEF